MAHSTEKQAPSKFPLPAPKGFSHEGVCHRAHPFTFLRENAGWSHAKATARQTPATSSSPTTGDTRPPHKQSGNAVAVSVLPGCQPALHPDRHPFPGATGLPAPRGSLTDASHRASPFVQPRLDGQRSLLTLQSNIHDFTVQPRLDEKSSCLPAPPDMSRVAR